MEFGLHCALAQGTVAVRTHLDSHAPQARSPGRCSGRVRDAWAGRIDVQAASLMPIDFFGQPQGRQLADVVAHAGGAWAR
jgi:cytosine deaminase